jgi:Flp pilus assembly protein TadB
VPKWLLPWLVPVGLLVVVVAVAFSPLIGAVVVVAVGLACLPFVLREYQVTRAKRPRTERPDRPNWLR